MHLCCWLRRILRCFTDRRSCRYKFNPDCNCPTTSRCCNWSWHHHLPILYIRYHHISCLRNQHRPRRHCRRIWSIRNYRLLHCEKLMGYHLGSSWLCLDRSSLRSRNLRYQPVRRLSNRQGMIVSNILVVSFASIIQPSFLLIFLYISFKLNLNLC